MKCLKCVAETQVVDSRRKSNYIYCRRECLECGYKANTKEYYDEYIDSLFKLKRELQDIFDLIKKVTNVEQIFIEKD